MIKTITFDFCFIGQIYVSVESLEEEFLGVICIFHWALNCTLGYFVLIFGNKVQGKWGFFYSYFSYSYNCNIESFQELFPSTSPGKLDPTTPSCKTCNLFTLYSNWRKKLTLLIKKVPAKGAWNYACGLYILTAFFYLLQKTLL